MLANEWGKSWLPIEESINNSLNTEMQDKCTIIDNKLQKLKAAQIPNTSTTTTTNFNFYSRAVNNTNINFTEEELALLNKGLNYNLHYKHENWITTLTFEAETSITLLLSPEQEPIRHQIANNIQNYTQKITIKNINTTRRLKTKENYSTKLR